MLQMSRSHSSRLLPFGLRSDRFAVSALFFMNGAVTGAWSAKIPLLVERMGIDERIMGGLVIMLGIGSLLMMPVFGIITARFGSDRALRIAAALMVPALLLISLSPNLMVVGAAIFLFGGFMGAMDVSMNANAISVEQHMKRAIMSSCHGFWSLGGMVGAGSGGILLATLGDLGHSVLMVVLAGILMIAVLPWLATDHAPAADATVPTRGLPRSALPYLLGIMALFAMIPEGSVLDWGGLFLRGELGADIGIASWAFAGFAGTMAIMRFAGDGIRRRLGAVTTVRLCATFAIIGMAVAGLAPNVPVAIAGFAIAGIGMSNLVPVLFSAAGNLPGIPPAIGLSIVTVLGYSGILLAPGLIGFFAVSTGFAPIFIALAALLLLPLLCAPITKGADFAAH